MSDRPKADFEKSGADGWMALCSVKGCERVAEKRGWCGLHYQRWRNSGGEVKKIARPGEPKRLCSVEGCGNVAEKRGWCGLHYQRWRKSGGESGGDPLQAKTAGTGEPEAFLQKALAYDGDECLIWPYYRSHGYAAIAVDGKPKHVHIIVCTAIHGEKPSPELEVAHSCGKGHEGCIAPKHLRWATSKQNKADQLLHGTRNRGERNGQARLTAKTVQEIRRAKGRQSEIALRFGISQSHVSNIRNGRAWPPAPSSASPAE
jgi:hypothetical protein